MDEGIIAMLVMPLVVFTICGANMVNFALPQQKASQPRA